MRRRFLRIAVVAAILTPAGAWLLTWSTQRRSQEVADSWPSMSDEERIRCFASRVFVNGEWRDIADVNLHRSQGVPRIEYDVWWLDPLDPGVRYHFIGQNIWAVTFRWKWTLRGWRIDGLFFAS